MKRTLNILFALVVVLIAAPLQARAQALELADVPPTLASPDRQIFEAKRTELLGKWDTFLAKKTAFTTEYQGTKEGTPRAAEAARIRGELKTEADGIVDAADNFTERLELTVAIQDLDKKIAETEKQLRGLGFKRAVPDFAWFAGQSAKARQQMISQLVGRVRDYTIGKLDSAMEEHFLEHVRTMKPKEVNQLRAALQRVGAKQHLFQEWLALFSPKLQRKVLVDGAKLAIQAVKTEEKLFKIGEEMDKETIESQQEAALTVLSMLSTDYPGMKELKLVATSAYDVLEAWATIAILDANIDELTTATEVQLANQKNMLLYRKSLIDKRKESKDKLASLPPL